VTYAADHDCNATWEVGETLNSTCAPNVFCNVTKSESSCTLLHISLVDTGDDVFRVARNAVAMDIE
jgi:hypothetical protein